MLLWLNGTMEPPPRLIGDLISDKPYSPNLTESEIDKKQPTKGGGGFYNISSSMYVMCIPDTLFIQSGLRVSWIDSFALVNVSTFWEKR